MPGVGSIDGIVSGLNTTEIVDNIMKFERRNAVLLEQEQAKKTTIISAYKALQAKFLALNTELINLTKPSAYESASLNVSDESVLSATSGGRVTPGAYDVQVQSLARNHQIASQGFASNAQSVFGTGTISIQVGDGSIHNVDIDANINSLTGIKQAINDADIGVTASVINDGSSSNAYRLILASDQTGAANRISVESELTGGLNLNFASGSFDAPETLTFGSDSTAEVSLGSTASYTGRENKIYAFTVEGSGSFEIGSDPVTLNWSDGVNSGSVVVTQADTEIELVGDGADGLKISLSAGTLTGGDSFQVGTFAPLLQSASDARIAIGSQGGLGSPIVVTSESNTFTDVIGGLNLQVGKTTAPGEWVTVTTDYDVDAVKGKIQSFIKTYNSVVDFIDEQNTYKQETDESGVLFGDPTLWMARTSLANAIGDRVEGIESKFSQLFSIGIRTKGDGKLAITDNARFEDAMRNNLDDVIRLLARDGSSTNSGIEFVSSTGQTMQGEDYKVDITQAAAKGYLQGATLSSLATSPLIVDGSNNTLKFKVDGVVSEEIYLTRKTYDSGEDLAEELQAKIDADQNVGKRGVVVEWVPEGAGGYLRLTSSTYGSSSVVSLESVPGSAVTALGLAAGESVEGKDVAGTINGETGEGKGQLLRATDESETIRGLTLRVTLDSTQLTDDAEGSVTLTKGVAARVKDLVESLTKSQEGTFDRRIQGYQSQVENIKERVAEIDERLVLRRERLLQRFYDMETALGEMNSISDFLTTQLAGINANWNFGRGSGSGNG